MINFNKGQNMERKKWKNKNFLDAVRHSLDGIKYAFQSERSLKIQLVCMILAIGLSLFLKLSCAEWGVLFLTIGSVFLAEMFNTTIEVMLDLYSEEYHEKIKLAKDIASGAVLIVALISVCIGGILWLPKIGNKLI